MAGNHGIVEGIKMVESGKREHETVVVEAESSHTATKNDTPILEPSSIDDTSSELQTRSSSLPPRSDSSPDTIKEKKDVSTTSVNAPLPSSTSPSFFHPASPSPAIAFITNSKGKYIPTNTYRLRNSLLFAVGLLELANAGDFAANVWNQIPVPTFAAVLMGLGGAFALSIAVFAFWDATLAIENHRSLKAERQHLKSQPQSRERDTFLEGNFRELGTELVDRVYLDLFMGFGSVMVGVGTFMAIGGANPRVYRASNLLSGYIGNAPLAAYGLVNAAWSIFIIRRGIEHRKAARKTLADEEVMGLLKQRVRRVQTHATILGTVGLVAGGASLVTADHWEGYAILVPCIVLSVYCNHIFRSKIGYDRALLDDIPAVSLNPLIGEIKYVESLISLFKTESKENIARRVLPNIESLASILEFLTNYDLFEPFCVALLADRSLSTAIFGTMDKEMVFTADILLRANKEVFPALAKLAEETILDTGRVRLVYRKRWLLECLGGWLCCIESKAQKGREEK